MTSSAETVWLLAYVAKGDREAFERLYRATSGKLYGVVLRILGRPDRAAEVVRDTYREVWDQAATFAVDDVPPLVRMIAIARRRALDVARSDDEPSLPDGDMVPDTAEPAPRDLAGNGLKHLLAALGRLEPDRQRMILSAYFTGATRDRLGADVGCPVDLVKVQLRYALADLREYLGR